MITSILTSCGYDTRDWPRITIPYEENEIDQINTNYSEKDKNEESSINDGNVMSYIYSNISFPFKEAIENEDVINGYTVKFSIEFIMKSKMEAENAYFVTFYNFGVAKGYVDVNGAGLHFLPGDIESFHEKIMAKLSEGRE
jgi:hypothetical protein